MLPCERFNITTIIYSAYIGRTLEYHAVLDDHYQKMGNYQATHACHVWQNSARGSFDLKAISIFGWW